jgi:hypothetical protein
MSTPAGRGADRKHPRPGEVCRFYSSAQGCRRGSACKYKHEGPPGPSSTPSPASPHDRGPSQANPATISRTEIPRGGHGQRDNGSVASAKSRRDQSAVQVPTIPMAGPASSSSSSVRTIRTGSQRGEKPCFAWKAGNCRKGENCRYAHDPEVLFTLYDHLPITALMVDKAHAAQIPKDEENKRRLAKEMQMHTAQEMPRQEDERHPPAEVVQHEREQRRAPADRGTHEEHLEHRRQGNDLSSQAEGGREERASTAPALCNPLGNPSQDSPTGLMLDTGLIASSSSATTTRMRPKRGEQPCFAWKDGNCRKGAKCWYAHDPEVAIFTYLPCII